MLPTIKELRAAAGGLENLTDEEIISATYPAYQQYYGSVDEFAKSVGYSGAGRGMASSRISAGIDNYQAGLLGLGGAASRAVGLDGAAQWFDQRRDANEQAAAYATQRGRDLGAVDDWREVDGVGSGLNYLGGLAAQSLPYLGEAVVGGLAARGLATGARAALRGATTAEEAAAAGRRLGAIQTGGAVAASYPSAVGDILANQREAGGEDLGSALLGGVPYAALNAFGVEGLAARGLRPFAAGEGRLARMATGAASTAIGEGLGETGQELANQYFGRMAVDPNETLFNEEANRRYLDSFVGGAALGGVFGGAGGIRAPRTVDQGQFDITRRGQDPQADTLGYDSPLGGASDRVREMPGFTGSNEFNDSFLDQARQGIADRTQAPAPAAEDVVSTQQAGKTPTPVAPATPSILTESDQFYANELQMPVPQGKARRAALEQLYNDAAATGVPLNSPALEPYWNQIGNGAYFGSKQQDRLRVLLQNAIVEHRKGVANVSQPSAPAGQPVGSGDGRSAPVVGGMGNTGPVPDVRVGDSRNAGNPQPAGGQAAPVADAGVQRPAAVGENTSILAGANSAPVPETMARVRAMPGFVGGDPNTAFVGGMRAANPQPIETPAPTAPQVSGEPVVQRKRRKVTVQPGSQANAYVTPEAPNPKANAPVAEDGYVDDEDAWEDFRPDVSPSFRDLSPGLQKSWADLRRMGKLSRDVAEQITAEHETDDTNETGETIRDVINQIFDKRDAGIIHDVFVGKMKAAQVAEKYGLDSSRVRQIAGTGKEGQTFRNKKIKAAQEKYGWTDEYVRSLMGNFGSSDSDVELDTDTADGRSAPGIEDDNSQQRDIAAFGATGDLTLGDVGMSTISSEGGSTGYKDTIGNRKKVLSKQEIDKLNTMRDGRDQLERDLTEAKNNGDEDLAEKIQGDIDELTGKIEKLESGKASPQEMAASLSQKWYDLTAKADDLERRVQDAEAAGLDTITDTKQGKRPLDEVKQEIADVQAKAAKALEKAKKLLEDSRKVTPAPQKKADAPKKESKTKAAKPQQDSGQTLWEKLRKQSPNLVAYDELTANERGYLTELADRTNGKPVVKNELGLQELMKRTAAPKVETTDAQRKDAEDHAKELGGTVVWQEGPLALIRGYSMLSGQPVYAVAKGASRSSVDVERFTGNAITPEQKARLVQIKKDLEAADAEQHAKDPFIKFDKNGLATSAGVDPRLAGVMAGWKNLLNIKANIYVTTLEDARADKDKFTGPHRAIGSAGLDANEAGSMRKMGDGYYIAFKKGTSYLKMLETLGHELGHVHQREAFDNADPTTQKAIRAEHDKFIAENSKKTGREFVQALRARATGRATRGVGDMQASELSSYWKSFSEWYADQVSKWATTSEKPVGVVEQFFAKLGAAIKKFYYALKGQKYLPNQTMKQFLDAIADRTIVIDPRVVSQDTRSESLLAGTKSFVSQKRDQVAELKAQLATAKLMQSNDESVEEIWRDTGWYFNSVDGKWRYEIPDTFAAFTQDLASFQADKEYALEDVLNHQALYEKYPQLREYTLVFDSKMPAGHGAFYKNGGKRIDISQKADPDPTKFTPVQVLLHEVQHAIQEIEGFSPGGSPGMTLPYDLGSLKKLRGAIADRGRTMFDLPPKTLDRLIDLVSAYNVEAKKLEREYESLPENATEFDVQAITRKVDTAYQSMLQGHSKILASVGVSERYLAGQLYELIAGEQEANLVAERANFIDIERRNNAPASRVQPENMLVNVHDAVAYSAPTQSTIEKTVSKLPKAAQQPARKTANALSRYTRKGIDALAFTSDLAKRAVAAGIEGAEAFQNLMIAKATKTREYEREVERIADMYAQVPEQDRGDGPNSVNQFIFDSTQRGQWGYDSGKFKANDEMAERFEKLDEKSQAFVKAVFAHGDRMLALKKQTVLDFTASEYDAHIKALTDLIKGGTLSGKKLTDAQEELAEVQKDKKNDLEKFSRLFSLREGKPYAPIKRFGPYAVVAKSATYMQAVEDGDNKAIRKLEQDANHYHVTFTETAGEADALADKLIEQGAFEQVQHFERSVSEDGLFGNDSMMAALTALRSRVNAQDRAGTAKLKELVSQMYLQELAENSARKSEMRRRGVVGEVDMLRSFTTQGRADAHFLASTRYGTQLQDVMQAMHKQSRGATNRLRASEVLNEVVRRYQQSFDYAPTPWIDKLRRMSSVYFLATSPAYYMQNLTQPWMMSVPAMAGAHDYTKVSKELFKAYGEMKELVKSGFNNQMFNYAAVPGDVRSAIQELVNRGKIDIGMDTELGEFRIEGRGFIRDNLNRVDKALRTAVQKVESINRLSTAMTAYRLERQAGRSHEQAVAYADRILTETHGDYTAFNSPRVFNTQFGKVALQFRKFQLIQLTYYAKLINDIVTSPRERAAALKMLTYSLGHTALLAGVRGLPGFAAIAFLASKLFGDDDEPYDLEAEIRKAVGDPELATLIMRGAPTLAGADISGKVGAGNMLSILPFSDADLTTRAGVAEAVGTLLGGASLGMTTRMIDGLGLVMGGDLLRGSELLMPKGVGDAFKAYRIADEGLTRRNGDILLSPDEVSTWESALQAMGIQPAQQAVVFEQQQRVKDMDKNFQDRSTKIKADYIKAVRNKDTEAMAEARQAWTKMQEARVRNGYTRQPLSNLLKAPQEQAKRERNTVNGVQFNKQNRAFVESQV